MNSVAITDATCRRLRPAFGTFVSVLCRAGDRATADRSVERAFVSFSTVQRLMHPTSGVDVAAIHSTPVGQAISVHRWTWQLLVLCARVNEISEGRFDPCLPEGGGHMTDIGLPEPQIVVLRERVALDLGGIAKGFAVDRAIDLLRAAGCNAGEVNAGGDMRVFGPAMPIWVRTQRATWPVVLRDQACAVTDPVSRDPPREHRGYYSRVSAGYDPAAIETPAIVLASNAAIADALTKCVLLCVRERALLQRILREFAAASVEFPCADDPLHQFEMRANRTAEANGHGSMR